VKTLIWAGLDATRLEIARVSSLEAADGTQIGVAYELRWELRGDNLRVQVVGGTTTDVDLDGADFFDVQHSAFFNSLPVMRARLLQGGDARDYTMRFVRVPELTVESLQQRYEPRSEHVVHYSSPGFAADIEFDAEGFVTLYHGYLKRVV
jgi:uncharacterized protein